MEFAKILCMDRVTMSDVLSERKLLSQISRGRLVSAADGAAFTLVALWLALITAAAATVILRA